MSARTTCHHLSLILSVAIAATLLACSGSPAPTSSPASSAATPTEDASIPSDADAPSALPAPETEPAFPGTAGRLDKVTEGASAMGGKTSPSGAADSSSPGLPFPAPALMGVSAEGSRPRPERSGLQAGYSDDNAQFNLFLKFLAEQVSTPHRDLSIGERIVLKVVDPRDRPVANAEVLVKSGASVLARGRTYSDGSFSLYPLEYGSAADARGYRVEVAAQDGRASLDVDRNGARSLVLRLEVERQLPQPLPVDILFVMDTTGSMGEEIERLRATIEIIHTNLSSLKPRPEIRFGLVLYRDREDEYLTELHPFTSDLDAFQKILDGISADGGGDTPEDLEEALGDSMRKMDWNRNGLRLAFAVTDAPPQFYPNEDYDYAAAARDAKEKGIKIFTIGTGGLPLEGEYVLRQIAQYTQAKYIFLTYGEKGESAGGATGSVSHHTGDNFTSDKLEAVVIRFVREEIARFSEKPLAYDESFYEASKIDAESREDTLAKLFAGAIGDLADYSSMRVGPDTRLAVLPIAPPSAAEGATLAANAEYFGAELLRAASASKLMTLVERKDLQALLAELELQLSGLGDEETAARVGKLLGAEVLITGSLYKKEGNYELFLRLVRVETAEVLSATKAKIDHKLGL